MFDLYMSTRYGSIAPNFPTTLNPGSFRGFFHPPFGTSGNATLFTHPPLTG